MTVAACKNKKVAALIVSVQLLRAAGIDAGSHETERELHLSPAGMKLMQSFLIMIGDRSGEALLRHQLLRNWRGI